MKTICKQCKYEFDGDMLKKCPRCVNIVTKTNSCENCKGCSLWKTCKTK